MATDEKEMFNHCVEKICKTGNTYGTYRKKELTVWTNLLNRYKN